MDTIVICLTCTLITIWCLLVLINIKKRQKGMILHLQAIQSFVNFEIMLEEYKLLTLRDSLEKLYLKEVGLGHYESCQKLQHALEIVNEIQLNYEKGDQK